uniref:Small ribosomal subunit protein uS14m n=1 Tax=Gossypium raimondii TaxID=29730 RepID=A0A0D2NA85_GOSRA|nr:hypothetical protein B456_001G161900 [Gossypium raimondii]
MKVTKEKEEQEELIRTESNNYEIDNETKPPWSGFCKKMRGKLSKMSEKRNIRDHKRRLLAAKYELRRKLYKAFCKDPDLPSDMRDKHRYKLSKLPRNSSFARVRNRCISTGRPRSVYEFFRISRIVFVD